MSPEIVTKTGMLQWCARVVRFALMLLGCVYISACALAADSRADLRNGLVGCWDFSNGVHDSSGNSYDGRMTGCTQGDRSIKLNGRSDLVLIPHNDAFNFGPGPFAVSCWMKTVAETSTGNGRDELITKGDATQTGFSLSVENNRMNLFYGWQQAFLGTRPINDGKWHHLFAQRDPEGVVTLYLDGRPEPISAKGTGYTWGRALDPKGLDNITTRDPLIFGRHAYQDVAFFTGSLGEIRIYNRTLSAAEVASLYSLKKDIYASADSTGSKKINAHEFGKVIFHGRYAHRSRNRDAGSASMWLAKQFDGDLVCLNAFGQMTTMALCDSKYRPTRYYSKWGANGSHLRFENKKISNYTDWNDEKPVKEYAVEEGAMYDPNTRPDPYVMANFLVRRFDLKPGESREFVMCDYGRNGDKQDDLPSYCVRVEHKGKEQVTVPAGTFDANHLVQTQLTPSSTWFKKGPGHVTEFWVLDDFTIVRILRHREPYEVILQEYNVVDLAKQDNTALAENKYNELIEGIKTSVAPPAPPAATITIKGFVKDKNGNPIAGASVTGIPVPNSSAEESKMQNPITVTTDANGSFIMEVAKP